MPIERDCTGSLIGRTLSARSLPPNRTIELGSRATKRPVATSLQHRCIESVVMGARGISALLLRKSSSASANSAVSVRKMSCTTRNSSAASALRTLLMFGSERNGFSPIMYMPRTPPLSALPTISVTVRPGWRRAAAPGASNFSCARRVVDALVVGEHHRDQARVGRALHVVLAAQRVQAGARPADVAGDRAHRDQAARVVGARRVLGDPHAPVDDARAGLAPEPRDLADRVGVDAADLRRALGRVLLDELGQLAVVRRRARG